MDWSVSCGSVSVCVRGLEGLPSQFEREGSEEKKVEMKVWHREVLMTEDYKV